MNYRTLGETGLKISEIGLGVRLEAGNFTTDTDALMSIRRALDLGVNLISTADAYGTGHSEELIGRALGSRSGEALVATKVGQWGDEDGHPLSFASPSHVRLCCDASLRRLRVDAIDLYVCHLNRPENIEVFAEAFNTLQEQQKIWHWGVSTDSLDVVKQFDRDGKCSVVEVEYNLLNRDAENGLFDYCMKERIGVLVRSPLAMGILTGRFSSDTSFATTDVRSKWLQDRAAFVRNIEKARKVGELAGPGRSMAQTSLAFALAHPAVACVVPGATRTDQIDANVAAADMPLSPEELQRARDLFA